MRKVLKGIGIVLGAIVGLVVIVIVASFILSEVRLNRVYDIASDQLTVTVPADAASIKAGERVANTRACTGCHGSNLAGSLLADIPPLARMSAANLTGSKGSRVADFTDADFVRAIRHGVARDGKPLWAMPSAELNGMSSADLGNLIAYIRSVPQVNNNLQANELRVVGRVLFALGVIPILSAEKIDHNAKAWANAPVPAVSVEYGKYLATACTGCHGVSLAGNLGGSPGQDKRPNLTPAGNLKDWSEADFMKALRGQARPAGNVIDPGRMPIKEFGSFSDDELKAIFMYIKTLSPKQTGSQ